MSVYGKDLRDLWMEDLDVLYRVRRVDFVLWKERKEGWRGPIILT
jgi:hypothetical protein